MDLLQICCSGGVAGHDASQKPLDRHTGATSGVMCWLRSGCWEIGAAATSISRLEDLVVDLCWWQPHAMCDDAGGCVAGHGAG